MAWGRKKSGGRKEPQFGLGASLSELRLSPQDRVAGAGDDEKPKKSPKRKTAADTDDDDDIPRERKPRARRGASKRRSSWSASSSGWARTCRRSRHWKFRNDRRPSRLSVSMAACWRRAAKCPAPMFR